jgi:hypothetical protein
LTPILFIEEEDYTRIKAWVHEASPNEIGGFGVIETLEDGANVVRHMRLLEQEVSSGSVDWDDQAFAKYLEWLYTPVENGGAGWTAAEYGVYSWHSHGAMSTFWSGTDKDFIERMGYSVPWMFSSVYNNRNEVKHRLDVFKGLDRNICPLLDEEGHSVTFESASLEILPHPGLINIIAKSESIEAPYDAEITKLEEELDNVTKDLKERLEELKKARKDAVKDVNKELTEATLAIQNGIKEEAKVEYEEKVQSPKWVWSGGKKTTTSGPSSKNGSKGSKNSSTGTKRRGSNGGKDTDNEAEDSGDFFEATWFRCFDESAGYASFFDISLIVEDSELILLEDITKSVWDKLLNEEKEAIKKRRTLSEEERKAVLEAFPMMMGAM